MYPPYPLLRVLPWGLVHTNATFDPVKNGFWILDSGLDIVYYFLEHLYVTFNFKQGNLQKNIFSLDSDSKPLYYLI